MAVKITVPFLFVPLLLSACVNGVSSSASSPQSSVFSSSSFSNLDAKNVLQKIEAKNQASDFHFPSRKLTFVYQSNQNGEIIDEEIRYEEGHYFYWKNNTVSNGMASTYIQHVYATSDGSKIDAFDFGETKQYSVLDDKNYASALTETLTALQEELKKRIHDLDLALDDALTKAQSSTLPYSSAQASMMAAASTFSSQGEDELLGTFSLLGDAKASSTAFTIALSGDFIYENALPQSYHLREEWSDNAYSSIVKQNADYQNCTPIYPDLSPYSTLGGAFF